MTHPAPNRRLIRASESSLDAGAPARDVALVGLALSHPALRDVVLMQWAFGLEAEEEFAREVRCSNGRSAHLRAQWLLGRRQLRPCHTRSALARRACVRFRSIALPDTAAALWSIEGWLNWAHGRSTQAVNDFETALAISPGYPLAELFRAYVAHGAFPDWAFPPGASGL